MKSSLSGAVLINTRWNFAGLLAPIVVAIVATPLIIHTIGIDRFGLLALAWAVMAYFYLLDLGLGPATTKFLSEHVAQHGNTGVETIVGSALAAHAALGIGGGILLAVSTPWMVYSVFRIPAALQGEALWSFLLLAASIPLVVIGTCLRATLEGYRQFKVVNITKIAGSFLTYVSPLAVIPFTPSLPALVSMIVIGRALILLAYIYVVVRVTPIRARRLEIRPSLLRTMFHFGGWITIASLTAPAVNCIDRAFLATTYSLSAIAFYATPYEIVTKLWIFSASLMSSLFPVFAAMQVKNPAELRRLCRHAFLLLLFISTPITGVVIIFARELLTLWISEIFGLESAAIAKFLALGVLINVLAQVPFTALVSTGSASRVGRIQLAELVLHVFVSWQLIVHFGAVGAAFGWTLRAALDAVLLSLAARRAFGAGWVSGAGHIAYVLAMNVTFLGLCYALDSRFREDSLMKLLVSVPSVALFVAWEYTVLRAYPRHHRVLVWIKQLFNLGPRPRRQGQAKG